MKRKTTILLVFAIVALVSAVSATLLTYYGQVQTTANVSQSVLLDGYDYSIPVTHDFDIIGGCCKCYEHTLENQGCVGAPIDIVTTYSPDGEGITTEYYKAVLYSYGETINIVDTYDLEVTVEDLGDSLKWTFDYPTESGWQGDGQLPLGVIIANDEHPLFQIHNNDGSCAAYPWGTWLYSAWDDTAPGNWNGWMTGDDTTTYNTPVNSLAWVDAAGEYYGQGTDGVLTVTIDKTELPDTFYWAAYPQTGGGWFAPYKNQQMPTPSDFTWTSPTYHTASLWETLSSPFTLPSGELWNIKICYIFNIAIMPGTYTITTEFQPATT